MKRLQEKLEAIDEDVKSLFSTNSTKEIREACTQLAEYINHHHTPEKLQELSMEMMVMNCIPLDSHAREAFDECILTLEHLHNCTIDRSDIKFSLEKLIMNAKLKAMSLTNEFKKLQKKQEMLSIQDNDAEK